MCWSKIVTIGIIAAGIALFSGCGEKTEKMQVSEALLPKPVSIVNFTFDGSPSKLTFSKVPQRVIVTRPEILDVLICLGVSDKVVAASFPMNTKDRIPYYKEKIPHAVIVEGELDKEVVVSKMEITTQHGAMANKSQTHSVDFYHLDAIIAVGYRVSSLKATRFRQWATKILNEYITKGFAMDDERLKQGTAVFGKDYFRELLERVRSIRASERRIWQQITDIYAECSTDYDKNSPTTREFYAMVQNRFHYAITGHTAAEIIYSKADHTKDHMGLTTWKNAPDGRVLKSDVSIAKNYLQEKEIRQLERAVTGFFDYIEDLIERENTFNMQQFSASVNEFLTFRRYQILPDKGKISAEQAKRKAEQEYEIFNKTQRIDSDFDQEIRGLLGDE